MSNKIIKPPIRELLCQRCDLDYPTWFTHNDLWNEVCSDKDNVQFLCPTCFGVLADEKLGQNIWTFRLANPEQSEAMSDALDSIPIYNRPHKYRVDPAFEGKCKTCSRNVFDTIHTTEK